MRFALLMLLLLMLWRDVKAGRHIEVGWPQTAYGVSKIGVTLMTPILQKEIEGDKSRPDIVINSVNMYLT